jgi:spermidine/putrescine transport system substrate-binding protein
MMRNDRLNSLRLIALLGIALATMAAVAACAPGREEEKVLDVYNWGTYIAPELIPAFEAKYSVKVNYTEFTSNDELYASLKAGSANYDIVVPTDYMAQTLIKENMLQPLNQSMIPNFSNIDTLFVNPPYDPNNEHCVPYQWGTAGLGYNKTTIPSVNSWAVMFNGEHAGRISWLNESRLTFGAALIYLGHDPNTTDPAQIDEATQLLLKTKPDVAAFAPDTGQDLLDNRTVDITMEWSGDIFQLMMTNPDVAYVIPREGAIIWTDNMCIPATALHPNLAHKFIDFILDADIGAALSNYTQYGTPNAASMPLIDQVLLSNPGIYPPKEVMKDLYFIHSVGDADKLYADAWAKLDISK